MVMKNTAVSPLNALRRVILTPTVGPLLALLLALIFFSTQSNRFLSGSNLSLIVQQTVVVGALAIGQTLVILTGGIDLSNGLVMAFSSMVMTKTAVENGVDPALALILGIIVGGLFGLINGLLITRLKLPPFIVTLGMYNIAFAVTRLYTIKSVNNLPDVQTFLGETFKIGDTGITYGSILMFILFFIVWFVLRETAIGRHIYAVGDNPEAARLTGISVDRILLIVYTTAGVFYGIAAVLLIARTGAGDPQAGQDANLESITAVVLGGTSLFGGRGNVLGTLIGALIVGVFRNGLQLMRVNSLYQVLITGILVILAVAIDQFSQRVKS
jgi:fructose transport system permease protein